MFFPVVELVFHKGHKSVVGSVILFDNLGEPLFVCVHQFKDLCDKLVIVLNLKSGVDLVSGVVVVLWRPHFIERESQAIVDKVAIKSSNKVGVAFSEVFFVGLKIKGPIVKVLNVVLVFHFIVPVVVLIPDRVISSSE